MKKVYAILCVLVVAGVCHAQSLIFSGTVSAEGKVQDDVLIDIYEYNSPIQTLHTDSKGYFSLHLLKGKEYILVFYKSGLVLQSVSVGDSRQNPVSNYFLTVNLEKDVKSPEGLYFKVPVKRIYPDPAYKYFTDTKFDLNRIKSRAKADSISVLLNRAQANQYILVGNRNLTSVAIDTRYSQQIEDNTSKEVARYADKLKKNKVVYDSLYAAEGRLQRSTMTDTGSAQLAGITETQRLLAERLAAATEHYLLDQQEMLNESRQEELAAVRLSQDIAKVTDSTRLPVMWAAYQRVKASAINDRYLAMDDNRKFQVYQKYQELNYQEYIELLRYKDHKDGTTKPATVQAQPRPLATISPADTSDNLSGMKDEKRMELIRQAMDEEERFKNYEEKTEVRQVDGEDNTVRDIRIANDSYEMQTDKSGKSKYFKNGKPVTRLTFDFETKRRMGDVLSTLRQVDKFGK